MQHGLWFQTDLGLNSDTATHSRYGIGEVHSSCRASVSLSVEWGNVSTHLAGSLLGSSELIHANYTGRALTHRAYTPGSPHVSNHQHCAGNTSPRPSLLIPHNQALPPQHWHMATNGHLVWFSVIQVLVYSEYTLHSFCLQESLTMRKGWVN